MKSRMPNTVDSFRFINGLTKRMIKNWISMEQPRPIPWTPLSKPLSQCTVALLSSAGLALKSDTPFDQEGERQNPWWGDPSYRILPKDATQEQVRLYHMHIDPAYAEQDLNCLFPLQRLQELESSGRIGRVSPRHYSIMGYILNPQVLLRETVPALIRNLKEDLADVVVLVPA
jgi:D-proline reductase (dithiol) PrdB